MVAGCEFVSCHHERIKKENSEQKGPRWSPKGEGKSRWIDEFHPRWREPSHDVLFWYLTSFSFLLIVIKLLCVLALVSTTGRQMRRSFLVEKISIYSLVTDNQLTKDKWAHHLIWTHSRVDERDLDHTWTFAWNRDKWISTMHRWLAT